VALSDITLKQCRSDLQSRLNEVAPDRFGTEELNWWINMSQFDVAMTLSTISNIWYGTSQTITFSATAGQITTVPLASNYAATKIMRIVKWVLGGGRLVSFIEDDKIETLSGNSNYDSSYLANWFGENLYLFVGSSAASMISNATRLFFIRKPDEMTSDSGTMDVPTEFYDLVILSAMSKATQKLNILQLKQSVDASVAAKYSDIRAAYSQEVQQDLVEEAPGVQTPRMR
jgi:hypothetical protein